MEKLKAMLSKRCDNYTEAYIDLVNQLQINNYEYKAVSKNELEILGKKWKITEFAGRQLLGYWKRYDYTTRESYSVPQYWNFIRVGLTEVEKC